MFRCFFLNRQWWVWSWLGATTILSATYYQVHLDVKINEWFGGFYDTIQQALAEPGAVESTDLLLHMLTFGKIAAIFVVVAILLDFFVRHYVFRWRSAMHHYYMESWDKVRHIEGAAQRVQEDTMRFAQLVQGLGTFLLRSVLTLIAFQPLLWELSKQVKEVPLLGEVDHILIYVAIISAIFGTVLMALVGIKLPGLEFNNQRTEAALRKELVFGEDDAKRARPESISSLFHSVRYNYVTMYRHYLYFDLVKHSYLQLSTLMPYIIMVPTIVSGAITLGVLQQILRAFNKVEGALHYLVFSWASIVELISVYKRLSAFEDKMIELNRQEVLSSYAS
ncbi:putative transporter [Halomonas citrativorans]|uniref:Transporter n=1 Tax=Halomonas citrativorans TaxID=2742612 RepID=A0ABR9FFM3_9GAMM|nr:putative transporter [Halomonas citrativorans]MBE0405273.1 putative transporter [Halomonas citrativorans]